MNEAGNRGLLHYNSGVTELRPRSYYSELYFRGWEPLNVYKRGCIELLQWTRDREMHIQQKEISIGGRKKFTTSKYSVQNWRENTLKLA